MIRGKEKNVLPWFPGLGKPTGRGVYFKKGQANTTSAIVTKEVVSSPVPCNQQIGLCRVGRGAGETHGRFKAFRKQQISTFLSEHVFIIRPVVKDGRRREGLSNVTNLIIKESNTIYIYIYCKSGF